MLDASALLWRLLLDGVDTGDRFGPLADAWAPKVAGEPWYAFNDLHAVMALRRRRPPRRRPRLIDDRATLARRRHVGARNARMTAEIGLPACRAVLAFVEDRHDDVIAELMPIRRTLHHFGGSHAQRDALAAHAARVRAAGGPVRAGPRPHRRTSRDARVERLQLEPAGACPEGPWGFRACRYREAASRGVPRPLRPRLHGHSQVAVDIPVRSSARCLL